ncbi:hypothetical protein GCM10010346_23190 [Streptomyces chryseus]|uniref:PPM-type phosphatase domain-containing protein n=2 Tax=Streptomyces chryseus TaxID=68186 RepID=A0ABQ3DMS1_9ACTN|nr:protein phosphatase 2C domain-containing protein [Streptomyces chryseus]GHA99695.1 hypothetical protein GCM10010346_23190 [Streptomyces chryseus]
MSQQGERRATSEDEWWNRLYDDEPVPEPAPARGADSDERDDTADAGDTLDARFESAAVASAPAPAVPSSADERDAAPAPPGPEAPAAPPPVDDRAAPPAPSTPPKPRGSGPGPADAPPWWVTHLPATAPKPPRHAPPPPAEPPTGPADSRPTSAAPAPSASAAPASPATAPEPPPPAPVPPPPAPVPPPPAPVRPPPPPVRPTAEAPHRAPWEAPDMSQVPPPRDESEPASPAARRPKLPRAPWRGARTTGSVPAQPSHPTPPASTGRTADGDSGGDEGRGGRPAPRVGFVGDRPPTYDAEPTALPAADPHELGALVADTVLDGARYGTYTLRAASVRGDSARYRGEPRRDSLLTARFGRGEDALVLVAVAGGARAAGSAHLAAADACRWIGEAVGRSQARLADDIRAGRRGDLKSGLHRLTDRGYGRLRARASELGLNPEEYTVSLRCLLLPADPQCRTRVFFGIGGGGLFRLRGGVWQDIEPAVPEPAAVTGAPVVGFGSPPAHPAGGLGSVPSETPEGDRLTMDLGIPTPPSPYVASAPPPAEPFRFRASVARPGDTLLLCGGGLADPLRGEPALAEELAGRWAGAEPPGLAEYLADTCLRVKGYADDRTAVAVWEA